MTAERLKVVEESTTPDLLTVTLPIPEKEGDNGTVGAVASVVKATACSPILVLSIPVGKSKSIVSDSAAAMLENEICTHNTEYDVKSKPSCPDWTESEP